MELIAWGNDEMMKEARGEIEWTLFTEQSKWAKWWNEKRFRRSVQRFAWAVDITVRFVTLNRDFEKELKKRIRQRKMTLEMQTKALFSVRRFESFRDFGEIWAFLWRTTNKDGAVKRSWRIKTRSTRKAAMTIWFVDRSETRTVKRRSRSWPKFKRHIKPEQLIVVEIEKEWKQKVAGKSWRERVECHSTKWFVQRKKNKKALIFVVAVRNAQLTISIMIIVWKVEKARNMDD